MPSEMTQLQLDSWSTNLYSKLKMTVMQWLLPNVKQIINIFLKLQ